MKRNNKKLYKARAKAAKARQQEARWQSEVWGEGTKLESFYTYSGKPSKHLNFAREHRAYSVNEF